MIGYSFKATSWHTLQLRLMLLRSSPDMVHDETLHKTLISTSLVMVRPSIDKPRRAFGPTIADLRYRAPLTPHLVQHNDYTLSVIQKSRVYCKLVKICSIRSNIFSFPTLDRAEVTMILSIPVPQPAAITGSCLLICARDSLSPLVATMV